MIALTPRQTEIATIIYDSIQKNRYAPTLRENAERLQVSAVTVLEHVKELERKSILVRTPNVSRGLQLVDDWRPPNRKTLADAAESAATLLEAICNPIYDITSATLHEARTRAKGIREALSNG